MIFLPTSEGQSPSNERPIHRQNYNKRVKLNYIIRTPPKNKAIDLIENTPHPTGSQRPSTRLVEKERKSTHLESRSGRHYLLHRFWFWFFWFFWLLGLLLLPYRLHHERRQYQQQQDQKKRENKVLRICICICIYLHLHLHLSASGK